MVRSAWCVVGALFEHVPPGFEYRQDFVSPHAERALVAQIRELPFSSIEMRGGVARRRTVHFGWTYGYERRTADPGPPIPDFLLPLREQVAKWATLEPDDFIEALITEYPAGAPIGWHRDAPMFGDVAGVSLLAACRMKFRPYISPQDLVPGTRRRTTHDIELAPRSAYLIRGAARREYEHHIPPVATLRYSITFRTAKM